VLVGATAEASNLAGDDALVRADLSESTPAMIGLDEGAPDASGPLAPGVLHVAIPFDDRIELSLDGTRIPSRPGFGITTAFDIETAGAGRLGYAEDVNRGWWIASQMVLWLAVLVMAAGARSPFGRRRTATVHDETLIDFDTEPPLGVAGEALAAWDDVDDAWGLDLHDEPDAVPQPERVSPSDPVVAPSSAPRAPLIVERPADPADEPVDLAALVADVEADADADSDEPEERS
jgi:hypothetical protein